MNLLVDISMYPLRDKFIPPIDDFIALLSTVEGVEVKTNRMSTQLYGSYGEVMALLTQAIKSSYEQYGRVVFVSKFIPGAEPSINGYE